MLFVIAIVSVILLPIILLYLLWRYNLYKYDYIEKIPGPPQRTIVGNFYELGSTTKDIFNNMVRLADTYGSVLRLWIGPFRLHVMLSEPKYVEYFLISNVHLDKSDGYSMAKSWLGNGLINTNGDIWKKHRKIITPTFHFKILDGFSEVFNSVGKVLIEKIKYQSNKIIDVYPLFNLYSLDVLCETSLGVKINAQTSKTVAYVEALHDYLDILLLKFFSIFKKFDLFFKLTALYKKELKCLEILRGTTNRVIQQRKKGLLKISSSQESEEEFGAKTKKTFLDLLLALRDTENSLTNEELNDEVNTFMFAGHHTVSSVLSFSIFCIAKYPKMQAIILEEIQAVIGYSKTEFITLKHVNSLTYLERFIKEVMRVYPPIPFIERNIKTDVEIGDLKLPKGTNITIFPFAMHHSAENFPDPEKFDPDRFLAENSAKRHKFAYIPFSAGPRNCIGFRFAMVEMKATLANIIRNFEVLPVVPEHQFILSTDVVLKSSNGIPVQFKIRD